MTDNQLISSVCVDDKRIRRSDCEHCGIRHRMLFSSLEKEQLSLLSWPINNMVFTAKTRLYHQGEPAQSIFSIRRGFVKLSQLSEDGEEKIVRLLGPGSCIGLEALAQPSYSHTAEALTEVDFCLIPLKVILELKRQQPAICDSLLLQWQQQLNEADTWLSQFFTGTIKQRLCRFLLTQQQFQRMPDERLLLISNQDIASVLASSDETISRGLSALRSCGILQRVEKRIYRLDVVAAKACSAL